MSENPTKDELNDYKKTMIDHMSDQMDFLKQTHEYEKLRSEIASYKLNQLICKVKTAEIMQPSNTEEDGKSESN
jgi:hypothetical protein